MNVSTINIYSSNSNLFLTDGDHNLIEISGEHVGIIEQVLAGILRRENLDFIFTEIGHSIDNDKDFFNEIIDWLVDNSIINREKNDQKKEIRVFFENMESTSAKNDFSRHFAFYNRFPNFRQEVPIIRKAIEGKSKTNTIYEDSNKIKSMEEINKLDIPHLIVVNLSTCDAQEAGFEVVRVLTPTWSLLTGVHNQPFLGGKSLSGSSNIYLKYPHPFP